MWYGQGCFTLALVFMASQLLAAHKRASLLRLDWSSHSAKLCIWAPNAWE